MEIRFKLNAKNSKDKLIIEYLDSKYNHVEFIKSNLYELARYKTPLSDDLTEVVGSNRKITEYEGGTRPPFTTALTEDIGSRGNLTEEFNDFF